MEARLGTIKIKAGLENTSGRWLVVGNYTEVISHHVSREEAAAALATVGTAGPDGLAETRWCRVDVVAPSGSISGELEQSLWGDDGRDAAELLAAMFPES